MYNLLIYTAKFQQIALSLPPSNDLIRRISASVDDAAATNHHQVTADAVLCNAARC